MTTYEDGAVISECGGYRYLLQRALAEGNPTACVFIMLNPSTADASQDDPTLRRCKTFANAWGFGRLEVVNLFSYRATNPADLKGLGAAVAQGPEHWPHVRAAIERADLVVCGWGADKMATGAGKQMCRVVRGIGQVPMCLGVTQAGQPRHPLYLKGSCMPRPLGVTL